MTLSCVPRVAAAKRDGRLRRIFRTGSYRRNINDRYSALKEDDEYCHWLLACQPPQSTSSTGCSSRLGGDRKGDGKTCWRNKSPFESSTRQPNADIDFDDDETQSLSLSCEERSSSNSEVGCSTLSPPSETDSDSDTADEDLYDEVTLASIEDFLKRILEPANEQPTDMTEEGKARQDDDGLSVASLASTASSTDLKSTATNRSMVRFADEVDDGELETIHLVPWSEHDNEKWIPRRVRCRVEL